MPRRDWPAAALLAHFSDPARDFARARDHPAAAGGLRRDACEENDDDGDQGKYKREMAAALALALFKLAGANAASYESEGWKTEMYPKWVAEARKQRRIASLEIRDKAGGERGVTTMMIIMTWMPIM